MSQITSRLFPYKKMYVTASCLYPEYHGRLNYGPDFKAYGFNLIIVTYYIVYEVIQYNRRRMQEKYHSLFLYNGQC